MLENVELSVLLGLLLFFATVSVFLYMKVIDNRNYRLFFENKFNPCRSKPFLTNNEKRLFSVLQKICQDQKLILVPQPHLSTFLQVKDNGKDLLGKFEWLNKYFVDYAIFNYHLDRPLLIIELNDRTHLWNHRRARDEFVSHVLRQNHIPLLTLLNTDILQPKRLEELILKLMNQKSNYPNVKA